MNNAAKTGDIDTVEKSQNLISKINILMKQLIMPLITII